MGEHRFTKKIIKEASLKFGLMAKNLQAAILIKSLEQALIWPNDLARIQGETLVKALDINFVIDLMS